MMMGILCGIYEVPVLGDGERHLARDLLLSRCKQKH